MLFKILNYNVYKKHFINYKAKRKKLFDILMIITCI